VPFASVQVESAEAGARQASFFYSEHGTGRPLVALHGWTLDHRAQEASLEALFAERAGWRRIYLDLLGHGRSGAPEWVRSHNDMLGAVSAFIDAVIPGQRFAVAGLSYGAALAHGLVGARAGQIDGVVLTVPPTGDPTVPQHVVRHADAGFVAELGSAERHQLDFVVWQSVPVLEEIRQRFDTGAAICVHDFLDRLGAFELSPLASPFGRPALLTAGRFDHWCGYRRLFDFLDDYPLATYAVLDGAGHGLTIEREKLYHALLADWLDRVEAT
jgi:pimeloyl-ACP methyl ester carboxylesterase